MLKKFSLIFPVLVSMICQAAYCGTYSSDWDVPPLKYKQAVVPEQLKNNSVVIISDQASFNLTGFSTKTLHRTVLVKIMNSEGLKNFHSVSLPESFDVAENRELWQQGRSSEINIPFIKEFHIAYFKARIIKPNDSVIDIKPEKTYSKVRWIKENGEYANDEVSTYTFKGLAEGDLLEYSYSMDYKTTYGSNMLYLASDLPKVKADYSFKYVALPQNKNAKFILTGNIPDSCIAFEKDNDAELAFITETIHLTNLQRVNYFIHAMSAKQLPYVYFNMNYTIRLFNNRSYSIANLPDYEWTNAYQRNSSEFDWYTKFPNDIRKFVSSFPTFEKDSNNTSFLKAVIDTLNGFKFYSANDLFYNQPRLYSIYSSDHLFKRRLSEMNLRHIYESILNDKGVFYYIANVQDKRLGENNPLIRNRAYENIIMAIPAGRGYTYFVPRYNGLKYFPGELPFYYEGAIAALFPVNYVKLKNDPIGNHFRFIRTYCGTFAQNVRAENCAVKINIDSLSAQLNTKESLTGQFSTVLRPYYLNELVDSTINPIYFKKCTGKPEATHQNISLASASKEYPFRHVFNCSEMIRLKKAGEISLENWFSFLFSKLLIHEKPVHDFYFDFQFTDIYNYSFEFSKPVNITNAAVLNRTLDNDYFGFATSLRPEGNAWIFSVVVQVKQSMLPKEEAGKLIEFVNELERLNALKIQYSE